jgi:hypothetical protein
MITEKIASILSLPVGYLLHEGFQVKCAGSPQEDGSNPDRHLICTLDSHLPGADAHAIGNKEFIDSLWILDPAQLDIDWSNPVCYCGKEIAP